METEETQNKPAEPVVTRTALQNFQVAAKWAKAMALLSYGFLGFYGLVGLIIIAQNLRLLPADAGGPGWSFALIYFGSAVLYYFPIRYIHLFSSQAFELVRTRSSIHMEEMADLLRRFYQYVSFLVILTTVIMAILIITMLGVLGTHIY